MTLEQLLDKSLNDELVDIIISNPKKQNKEFINANVGTGQVTKIKVRPVILKNVLSFQATSYVGAQVFHENYDADEIRAKLCQWIENGYKQAQVVTASFSATVLSGKKGNVTVKFSADKRENAVAKRVEPALSNNRTKKYLLKEGVAVPFLVDLKVMTADGMVVKARYDKFKQINRFLEFIDDVADSLCAKEPAKCFADAGRADKTNREDKADKSDDNEITIIDFGCGKSYLTFAMYYYFTEIKKMKVKIIGLDLKQDVIDNCNKLAKKYEYEGLSFITGDVESYEGMNHVDMVVTLHACDTATDYALYKAIKWGAKAILSVPCCQHEANRQIENEQMKDFLKYGLIKEKFSSLMTDAIRANILEECGYKTQILEFIDMEHTPKNMLIRAIKNSARNPISDSAKSPISDSAKNQISDSTKNQISDLARNPINAVRESINDSLRTEFKLVKSRKLMEMYGLNLTLARLIENEDYEK